ncbi:MAG: hypothetical protein ACI9KI_000453 [Patiriisocius sp.]|jgi:hypothetical protein
MKQVLIIFTLLVSITLFAQTGKAIDVPQIVVKVGLDQTINLDGTSITFLKVIEDSRCPNGVDCIWEGEAKVLIRIGTVDGEVVGKTLTFKNGMSVIAGFFNNKELQFLQLTPHPDANISEAEKQPYALLLRALEK